MKKTLVILLLAVSGWLLAVDSAHAAILSFEPVSTSAPVGDTFDVQLLIDTKGESATSADVILLYDSSVLQVNEIVNGSKNGIEFFPDFFQNITDTEIYIGASVIEPVDKREGTGTLATITFQGKVSGASDVAFDCTPGKTSDTNISKSDKNATDIVECELLTNGRYTIGDGSTQPQPTQAIGGGGTGTPTPTRTPTPTLFEAGSGEVTMGVVGLGFLLLLFGLGGKALLRL